MSRAFPARPLAPADADCPTQLMFVGNICYSCAITFTKLSIIASYLRIFPYKKLRIAMYVTAVVTVGLFVASVPATIFQCRPISAAWDFETQAPPATLHPLPLRQLRYQRHHGPRLMHGAAPTFGTCSCPGSKRSLSRACS